MKMHPSAVLALLVMSTQTNAFSISPTQLNSKVTSSSRGSITKFHVTKNDEVATLMKKYTNKPTEEEGDDNMDADVDVDTLKQKYTMKPVELTPEPKEEFVNNGPFAIMGQSLKVLGFQEGKKTYYGPPIPVDPKTIPSEEVSAKRREEAAKEMINIDDEERARRQQASDIAFPVALSYAIFASLCLDNGDLAGHLNKFAVFVPLTLAIGYQRSAKMGLWNVAQGGMWDVDGTGIRKIDDMNLARALLGKTNDMNISIGRDGILLALGFALLPQSVTTPLAGCSAVLSALYYLNGKLPKEVEVEEEK